MSQQRSIADQIAGMVVDVLKENKILNEETARNFSADKLLKSFGVQTKEKKREPERADPFARYIDHTVLKPSSTEEDIRKVCAEAREFGFASVCVNPCWVTLCAEVLENTGITVCTVAGFALGSTTTAAKASEAREAVANGAGEVDMVINVGKLKSGDFHYVAEDIRGVVEAAGGRTVKVIIETALLTEEEKLTACILSKGAGAHFVKTSTGFNGGGATEEDIKLMRAVVGPDMGVKASGGIRDRETAEKMIAAGATRLGCSASVEIMKGKKGTGEY